MVPLNDDFDVYIKRKNDLTEQRKSISTSKRFKSSNQTTKNKLLPEFQKFERILKKRIDK